MRGFFHVHSRLLRGSAPWERRLERAGRPVGLYATSRSLSIELLETIQAQTLAEVERPQG